MAANRVRLLNTTDKPLRLRYKGESITFQPHATPGSVLALPKEYADYVVGHVGNQVEVIAESAAISYVDHAKAERFYLANFSGDPDSPEFFETSWRGMDGQIHSKKVFNDLHTPKVYKARLGRESKIVDPGAHTYQDPQTGKNVRNTRPMQVTYPGKLLNIPPYTVVEVTKGQYTTLLNSEIDKPDDYPRFLRPSRSPSEFEPDFNDSWWTLDRLRAYVEMYPETNEREAGSAIVGPSEADLRKQLAAEGLDEDAIELRIESARFDMFGRGKLRAMDLNYIPPTKAEFDSAWARKSKEKKSA